MAPAPTASALEGWGQQGREKGRVAICQPVLVQASSGFNRNPVTFALLPLFHRRCSSPGVREEQTGREGWLCSGRCVFSCAVHTIGLQPRILVPQSNAIRKLVPSHCQVPRVTGALFIPEEHVLCLSVLATATGLVSCPTFPQPQRGEVRD